MNRKEVFAVIVGLIGIVQLFGIVGGFMDGSFRYCTNREVRFTYNDHIGCCDYRGKWNYVLWARKPACDFSIWMSED